MNYNTLENHYRVSFSLVHHHKYSIFDVENLIPYERDIYVDLISAHIAAEQKAADAARGIQRAFA